MITLLSFPLIHFCVPHQIYGLNEKIFCFQIWSTQNVQNGPKKNEPHGSRSPRAIGLFDLNSSLLSDSLSPYYVRFACFLGFNTNPLSTPSNRRTRSPSPDDFLGQFAAVAVDLPFGCQFPKILPTPQEIPSDYGFFSRLRREPDDGEEHAGIRFGSP